MSSRSAVVLEVELLVRGRPTRTWTSEEGVITVGSGEGMTLRAGGKALAPHHATIHVEGNEVIAIAEGAAPVLQNDEPVSVAIVQPSDLLRIGPLTLRARLNVTRPAPVGPPTAQAVPSAEDARLCVRVPGGRVRTVTVPDGRYVLGATEGHLLVPGLEDPHAELSVRGGQILLHALQGPIRSKRKSVSAVALDPGVRAWLGTVEVWVESAPELPLLEPIDEMQSEAVTSPRPPRAATPLPAPTHVPSPTPLPAPVSGHEQVQPSPSRVPRSAAPTPSGRVPSADRRGKHPDDEDYDDELDFVAPFDLAGMLCQLPPAEKVTKGPCVASVLQFQHGRVRDLGLVVRGEVKRVARGGPVVSSEDNHVVVTWPAETREVHGGRPTDRPGVVVLRRGEGTVGAIHDRVWRVRAIRPAGTPLMLNIPQAAGAGILFAVSFVMSLFAHSVLGLSVESFAVIEPDALMEEVQEEQFAEVEMRIEEPPEVVQQRETLTLSEKAPTVSREQVTQASEMPRSDNTSVSSLLDRLAASEASAAGLTEGISNIDAVAAPSSANTAFNLAGRLSASSGVKVARSGTGAVNTSGQVGEGVGKLNAGARKGVRGRVTKLASRMKVRGTLDPAEVTRVVNSHMNAIQACYEREMMKQPGLAGRILFEWTIATNGTVRGVRVQSSTMPSDVVANCVSAEIKTWRFPTPKGGDAVISYPFAFRSG